jgi:hypothetical protein
VWTSPATLSDSAALYPYGAGVDLSGAEAVALAGVVATVVVAALGAVAQQLGEHSRRKDEREKLKVERWIDQRLDLYAKFLDGGDRCVEHHRERVLYVQGSEPPPPGRGEHEPRHAGSMEATAGMRMCADALSRMRVLAPGPVIEAATDFLEATRELEYFAVLQVVGWELLEVEDVDWSHVDTIQGHRDERARKVVAAMREDLGSGKAIDISLGDLGKPAPYL